MIASLVLIPFLAWLACLLFPRGSAAVAVGATGVNFLIAAAVAAAVAGGGGIGIAVEGWMAAAEIGFLADGLSVILVVTAAFAGLAVVGYAWFYLRLEQVHLRPGVARRFWLLWLALLTGLNGLLLSTNLLMIFFFLELVGMAAVGMAALAGTRRARAASLQYYFARLPGSLAFFLGVALMYAAHGTLDLGELAGRLEPSPLMAMAAALLLFGVVAKASLFPFHFWLPPAHSGAIGPGSAMLSGVVVKGPFYVALRLWFDLFPEIATTGAAQLLGALGAGGIIWGAIQALRAQRLKLIIAYSTVSQMGFLFLLFPLLTGATGTDWTLAAWTGGMYQLVSHAVAKAALLLAAGVVLYALGSERLRDMNGIASRMPVTTFAIALSCVTLIGLPPSGGFVAKWLLLTAAIESGQWWWIPPLVGGALLTAAYAFHILSYAFRSTEDVPVLRPVPLAMELTTLGLALAAVVIGLRVQEPMLLIEPVADPAGMEEVVR